MKFNKNCSLFFIIILSLFCSFYGIKTLLTLSHYQFATKAYSDLQSNVSIKIRSEENIDSQIPNNNDISNESFINWNNLENINPDIIGWIVCPDTQLNYPILKSHDNQDYVKTLVTGEVNSSGSIFLDYRNSTDFQDNVSIIYGHNMKNGSMFKTINHYKKEEFYQEHPYIYIATKNNIIPYHIISVLHVSASDDLYNLKFNSLQDYSNFLLHYTQKTLYTTNAIYSVNKPTIALSTCNEKGYRIVVLIQKQ